MSYTRNSKLKLKRIDGELFLFNDQDDSVFTLNPTAYVIWELCDGFRDAESIIEELSMRYDVHSSKLSENVFKVIDEFKNLGLITNGKGHIST